MLNRTWNCSNTFTYTFRSTHSKYLESNLNNIQMSMISINYVFFWTHLSKAGRFNLDAGLFHDNNYTIMSSNICVYTLDMSSYIKKYWVVVSSKYASVQVYKCEEKWWNIYTKLVMLTLENIHLQSNNMTLSPLKKSQNENAYYANIVRMCIHNEWMKSYTLHFFHHLMNINDRFVNLTVFYCIWNSAKYIY